MWLPTKRSQRCGRRFSPLNLLRHCRGPLIPSFLALAVAKSIAFHHALV
jgi:hypothetical protein